MDRAEAEAIYDAGREMVVEVLLRMDRRIRQLEARVEKLKRELKKSGAPVGLGVKFHRGSVIVIPEQQR